MELDEIQSALASSDLPARMKAVTALRQYDADVAVPLLMTRMRDPEFLLRSFVAMGLGKHQTEASFAALLEMLRQEKDGNVKAEAANSLSFFGPTAIPHLVEAFNQNTNWLVRHSILACLVEMDCPDELLAICRVALADSDMTVQEAAIESMGALAGSPQQEAAIADLVNLVQHEAWNMRLSVARALVRFDHPQAQAAIAQLQRDADHRVAAVALNSSL